MLQYQRDRLRKAAEYFGWEHAVRAVESGETTEAFLEGEVERWRREKGEKGKGVEGDLRVCF